MQWEEISEEEVKALKLSSRSNGRNSQYKELLDAVKGGKTIKVKLAEGMKPKTMAQRLYTTAKAGGFFGAFRMNDRGEWRGKPSISIGDPALECGLEGSMHWCARGSVFRDAGVTHWVGRPEAVGR